LEVSKRQSQKIAYIINGIPKTKNTFPPKLSAAPSKPQWTGKASGSLSQKIDPSKVGKKLMTDAMII
jgi:hypothetical protein